MTDGRPKDAAAALTARAVEVRERASAADDRKSGETAWDISGLVFAREMPDRPAGGAGEFPCPTGPGEAGWPA